MPAIENIEQVEVAIEQNWQHTMRDLPPAVLVVLGETEVKRMRSLFAAGFYCGCNWLFDTAKGGTDAQVPTD